MGKLFAFSLVFIASFCLMVIELIAGRIIAPFVGVSIYTWTSVIGIVLLGITLGNWVGGSVADKYPQSKTLGIIFILSALSSLSIIFITPLWAQANKINFSLPAAITLFSFMSFFPVAFFLSFTTPLIIKLRLHNLERTGRTVGNIYGFSAAGSILGTFLTGFWFVSSFGTKNIIWVIFLLLALIGFYFLFKNVSRRYLVFILLIVLLPLGGLAFSKKSICQFESRYYCIRVNEDIINGQKRLALVLDQLDHGYLFSPDYDPFGYDTFRIFAALVNYKFQQNDKFNVMVIGGGAYILPRYIIENYPNASLTVLEIDPKVTEVNYEELNLQPNERLKIIHGDARYNINRFDGNEKFNFIFVDAFSDFLVPYHLTTQEFIKETAQYLTNNGIYFMHIIDSNNHGQFLSSNLLTISSVFPNTYLFPLIVGELDPVKRQTQAIVGTNEEINPEKWSPAYPINDAIWESAPVQARNSLKNFIPFSDPELQKYISDRKGVLLTDDYAPVEQMLAPLFAEQ